MFHIRKASDHDERSLHMENEEGLHNAVQEAVLRTQYTGEPHQIVDDNGKLIAMITEKAEEAAPEALPEPVSAKHKWTRPDVFLLSAVLVAMIVHFVARAVLQ